MLCQVCGAILLQHDEDKVQERSSHFETLDGGPDDVADKCEDIEDPRKAPAFGYWGHEEEDQKEDRRGPELSPKDDGGANSGQSDQVNVEGADSLEPRTIRAHEFEGLVEHIEVWRQSGGHAVFDISDGSGILHDWRVLVCDLERRCEELAGSTKGWRCAS